MEYEQEKVTEQLRKVIFELAPPKGMEIKEAYDATAHCLGFEVSFVNLGQAQDLEFQMRTSLLHLLSSNEVEWTDDRRVRQFTGELVDG